MRLRLAVTLLLLAALIVGFRYRGAAVRPATGLSNRASGATPVNSARQEKPRPVYPLSVIPGGAYDAETIASAVHADLLVAKHYGVIRLGRLLPVVVERPRRAYVSYRKNGVIYWTAKPVQLRKGEVVLSDGKEQIRARCGNRIATTPQLPVEPPKDAPTEAELDTPITPALAGAAPTAPGEASRPQPSATPVQVAENVTPNLPIAQGGRTSLISLEDDILTPIWPTQISNPGVSFPTSPGQPVTPPAVPPDPVTPPEVTPPIVIPPPDPPVTPPVVPPVVPPNPPNPPVNPPANPPPTEPPVVTPPPDVPPNPPPPGDPPVYPPPGPPDTPPPCCAPPPPPCCEPPPPEVVPEPETFVMLGLGLAAAAGLRRRQSPSNRP